jgi:hypothetical protein
VRAQSALPARLGSFRPSLDPESAPRPRLLTKRPGFLDRRHSEPKSSPHARQRFIRHGRKAESGAPQHRVQLVDPGEPFGRGSLRPMCRTVFSLRADGAAVDRDGIAAAVFPSLNDHSVCVDAKVLTEERVPLGMR